jgi:hypothetical protein
MLAQNREGVFERPLMTVWLDETGILNIISKATSRTKFNLEADHRFLIELIKNKKVCVLIDTTHTGLFTTERIEFTKKEMKALYKAVALVANTEAGKSGSSIVSSLTHPSIPVKLFACHQEAREWLKQYL